jgi:hypothetical protein
MEENKNVLWNRRKNKNLYQKTRGNMENNNHTRDNDFTW